jgi:uncharacterized membrane protein YfcA
MAARAAKLAAGAAGAAAQAARGSVPVAGAHGAKGFAAQARVVKPSLPGAAPSNAAPAACVSAPLKPGWQYGTTAWGTGAGALSALTGLGGAVVFVPACSRLGMTAKKIIGTTVVAVTCATTAGSYAYTQNNVTDIPAAFAIGAVGACTTPIGQRLARNVSGKTLRRWCGGALLACAPTAFMKKKKDGDHLTETTVDGDHAPGGTAEVRPGGAAALALAGKADELVARGGILEYLMTGKKKDQTQEPTRVPVVSSSAENVPTNDSSRRRRGWFRSRGASNASDSPTAHSVREDKTSSTSSPSLDADSSSFEKGQSGSAWINFFEQFRDRVERAGGVQEALWAEREHLLLGVAVGLLQGTVGVGGGVLVTTYMSIMSDMEVHRICATGAVRDSGDQHGGVRAPLRARERAFARRRCVRCLRDGGVVRHREERLAVGAGTGHTRVHRRRARRVGGEHVQVRRRCITRREVEKTSLPRFARWKRRSQSAFDRYHRDSMSR